MKKGMFLISRHGRTSPSDCAYYSSHGVFQGVEDIISYSDMGGGKKFFTRQAAQTFIDAELPEYAKSKHSVVEMSRYKLMLFSPEDFKRLLEWERNRQITRITFRVNPEDSKGVDIAGFYDNVAAALGFDTDKLCYDCTKISVARNIQKNIFETLDAKSSDSCYTGMMWVARGPKTCDELADDTVELLHGFFNTRDENPLSFIITTNIQEAA